MNPLAEVQSNRNGAPLEKQQQQKKSTNFFNSFSTTLSKMDKYILVLKVHGCDAIQIWSSEPFKRTSSISSASVTSHDLGAWSSCSSLSSKSINTINSTAPSRASTICSEDETDEDYFSGTEASVASYKSTQLLRYVLKPINGHLEKEQVASSDSTTLEKKDFSKQKPDELDLIVLEQPSKEMNNCKFTPQSSHGQAFKATDMVIFCSKPIDGRHNLLY